MQCHNRFLQVKLQIRLSFWIISSLFEQLKINEQQVYDENIEETLFKWWNIDYKIGIAKEPCK